MSAEQLLDLGLVQQLVDLSTSGLGDVVDEREPSLPIGGGVGMPWSRWLLAFAVTQAVEIPIYLLSLRERPWKQRLWVAFMASAITHPIAWAMGIVLHPFVLHVIVAETFAVVVESLWLRHHGVPRALWWALTANAASVAVFIAGSSLVRALGG
jgi:hypothetical protein